MSKSQLIDYDGNFIRQFERWWQERFGDVGFDYSVVTVLGCQSSGKSTLLNALFQTEFEVMDASLGRGQTTKGLWISADYGLQRAAEDKAELRDPTKTLIIDVEGTDSKERGGDHLAFEHRASLFSLALADVVLVNMWYHDLGRYTASNYGLLKTVFQVNLELFQQQPDSPKTVLLFIIRDFSLAQTPLEKLGTMILTDIREIWSEIRKPDSMKHSTAQQFFDFATVGLPSLYVDPGAFYSAVADLRLQWIDKWRPRRYSRNIPSDGFFFYSKSVWETILKSSDLDIPSQKALLASFRCEEIMLGALTEVEPAIRSKISSGIRSLDELVAFAKSTVLTALDMYDTPASRYDPKVFQQKRSQLLSRLNLSIQKLSEGALIAHRKQMLADADAALAKLTSGDAVEGVLGEYTYLDGLAKINVTLERWRNWILSDFDGLVAPLRFSVDCPKIEAVEGLSSLESIESVTGSNNGTVFKIGTSSARQALEEGLQQREARCRDRLTADYQQHMRTAIQGRLTKIFENLLSSLTCDPKSFWKDLGKSCSSVKDSFTVNEGYALQELFPENDPSTLYGREVVRSTHQVLSEIAADRRLYDALISRFSDLFSLDSEGVPRQWHDLSADAIKKVYISGRDKTLEYVKILSDDVGLPIDSLISDCSPQEKQRRKLPILTEEQRLALQERLSKSMMRTCQEAQLMQATGSSSKVPPLWAVVAMLVLGWNELVALLTSPFLLLIAIVGVGVIGLAYFSGNRALIVDFTQGLLGVSTSIMVSLLRSIQMATANHHSQRHDKDE